MNVRDVPHKANYVLHLILIAFLLILLRIWYLTTVKHEEHLEKALRPQRRTVVEPASRGTIRDRFNIPLAINKLQYNAAIYYDRIREIPVVNWVKKNGKKVKVYERRKYIERLSKMLGKALQMDPLFIEDLIYSKASIFPNTPFVLKEDISEKLYYQLRLQEKDWTGLQMQRANKRYYPQEKVGADILGYMGAINQKQYLEIAQEIHELREFITEREEGLPIPLPKGFFTSQEVQERLQELKEKAYTIHAHVGKSGIERKFDENLRGTYGKKCIEIGVKGRFIRYLPESSPPISGEQLLLTISSELQAYAEELLIQSEGDRERHFKVAGKNHDTISSPWIKGGAIVATLPDSGEVVALASYPRFDPNDFILTDRNRQEKISRIYKWLESPIHVGNIWDGICPLEREHLGYVEKQPLTWNLFLDMTLSLNGSVRKSLRKVSSVKDALHLKHLSQALLKLSKSDSMAEVINSLYPESKGHTLSHLKKTPSKQITVLLEAPLAQEVRKKLDQAIVSIKHNDDKLLFLDLLRLATNGVSFPQNVQDYTENLTLGTYRQLNQAFMLIQKEVQTSVKMLYLERIFPLWRKKHFKAYLKEKREEEKERKTYPHPYTDYLAEAEAKLFKEFWGKHKWKFFDAAIFGTLDSDEELRPFLFHLILNNHLYDNNIQESLQLLKKHKVPLSLLTTFCTRQELVHPLWGYYYSLRKQTLQDLAGAFYPKNGFGYGKSFAYGRSTSIGSLFKLVTGYEALKQTYLQHEEHHLSFKNLNPLTIIDEVNIHQHTKNGIVLGRHLDGTLITRQYKGGRLPRTHAPLGKVDFRTALERSSNIYFSLLAGEVIKYPADLQKTAESFGFGKRTGIDLFGEINGYVPDDLRHNQTGLYAFAIGQHSLVVTPLQTAMMLSTIGNGGHMFKPQIVKLKTNEKETLPCLPELKHTLFMPDVVRTELLEGMRRVVMGDKGAVQPYRIRTLYEYPKWIPEYKKLQKDFIGKTSTAEFIYRPTLDREGKPVICKDIWFGSLLFKEDEDYRIDTPELSVVVYLKFGDYGKEAAPLAAQIIKKWREIQKHHKISTP